MKRSLKLGCRQHVGQQESRGRVGNYAFLRKSRSRLFGAGRIGDPWIRARTRKRMLDRAMMMADRGRNHRRGGNRDHQHDNQRQYSAHAR